MFIKTANKSLFAAEVKDPEDFDQPHYETGKRAWLTLEEFKTQGRQNQLPLVKQAYDIIWQTTR